MDNINLYTFFLDCGRSGSVEGLFIATEEEVQETIGKSIYFGEVLGKHSELIHTLKKEDVKIISQDQEKVEWLEKLLGRSVSGLNPIAIYQDNFSEC